MDSFDSQDIASTEKLPALVWVFNIFWVGLGNLYASGNCKRGWYPVLISLLLLFTLHLWWAWPVLYLVFSFYGINEVKKLNRLNRRHREHQLNSSQDAFATDDLKRKLEEADHRILHTTVHVKTSLKAVNSEEKAKAWLASTVLPAATAFHGAESLEPIPAETVAAATVSAKQPHMQPSIPIDGQQPGKLQEPVAAASQSAPVAYTMASQASSVAAGALSDWSQHANSSLGITDYQPYMAAIPQSPPGASEDTCKRCGTTCNHDYSFCLHCGHSYALS